MLLLRVSLLPVPLLPLVVLNAPKPANGDSDTEATLPPPPLQMAMVTQLPAKPLDNMKQRSRTMPKSCSTTFVTTDASPVMLLPPATPRKDAISSCKGMPRALLSNACSC